MLSEQNDIWCIIGIIRFQVDDYLACFSIEELHLRKLLNNVRIGLINNIALVYNYFDVMERVKIQLFKLHYQYHIYTKKRSYLEAVLEFSKLNFQFFKFLLALWASNKNILCSQRRPMICCCLWPQLNELFIFKKKLFILARGKRIYLVHLALAEGY